MEEKVARPDVLSYEQGRQDERKKVVMRPIDLKELPKEIEHLIKQAKDKGWEDGYTAGVVNGDRRVQKAIQQAKAEERKKVLTEIEAGAVSVAGLIEKARIEVAREIFEEIEAKFFNTPLVIANGIYDDDWQSLKSRFLKEEK